jgi:hypothetical protein
MFTGVAIMQLRDRGALSLDDPVVNVVPELRRIHNRFGDVSAITIRRLMSHSAGLRSSTWPAGRQPALAPVRADAVGTTRRDVAVYRGAVRAGDTATPGTGSSRICTWTAPRARVTWCPFNTDVQSKADPRRTTRAVDDAVRDAVIREMSRTGVARARLRGRAGRTAPGLDGRKQQVCAGFLVVRLLEPPPVHARDIHGPSHVDPDR